jgi:predicted double-glycine peptidase
MNHKGYLHYVVFNGIDGKQVLIADPAFGHRRMDVEDFTDAWVEGLAFVIEGRKTPKG